jgi:ABC-type multidrug transport system fused ATPase/permease subunit
MYRRTSRETRRLESASRSPLYSHFNACLQGVSTIRAYLLSDQFFEQNCHKYNYYLKHFYMRYLINRWLGVRIEGASAFIILFASLLALFTRHRLSSSTIGLSISFALNITGAITMLVRWLVEVESNLTSAERIIQYCNTDVEAPARISETEPPEDWPQQGSVEFADVQMAYRPDLDPVLKGVTATIRPGEKVGIVGRTGAGKSSLSIALLRLVELCGGKILVDDIDISTIGLDNLRRAVTIIPQAPIMFSGTIRSNIDPFQQYDDYQLWQILERVHMKDKVDNMPFKLDEPVTENGSNLSIGEKQLLCLARSIIRKSKIVLLDEATANIDNTSDQIIQQTIRQEFQDSTVITIAHRLDTIIDSDRIIVMDSGKIVEFDTPHALLNRPSLFLDLVNETGSAAAVLKEQAANKQR